ncbi:MAG TPA: phosphoribosylformylglycinamidine synthase subunit PurL [Solirubrobacteraceae bacterium]
MADSQQTLPGLQDALALGLTESEYELVCEKQGGPPNVVELAMYSLLWSEHCAYKHSKKLLRTLPTQGSRLVMGPGENAGAVDIGDGLVCAFKVESHNHPSAVEPFQGAATGVGGILRDIFAIGARPIAVLDSLRFGEPLAVVGDAEASSGSSSQDDASAQARRARYLLDGAVAGIAHYGNSVGVPTIGGEVYFEGPYGQSCLVNAMALGIAPRERLMSSAAVGVGNTIVLFGASTGRDGIGGASVLASAELGQDDGGKRPTVQVGDPFEGKKLLECSLELVECGLLATLQDLGAAGLTSSAAEMAAKGGLGVDLDVARVPLREADMEPFEIMVSESQERMLCVVTPDKVEQVLEVCARWEVGGAAIGEVTGTGKVRVLDGERVIGEMPVAALVDDCPLYDLQPQRPQAQIYPAPAATLDALVSQGAGAGSGGAQPRGSGSPNPAEILLALLRSPNIASRRPLFEHYDPVVQSRTVRRPQTADAAVLAIHPLTARDSQETLRGIAVSIDCNGRRVAADPRQGTIAAVLECAANLACVGAEPLGLTDNLNFGNPEKPHIAWQLQESVAGLREACLALDVPVVGGNVSLYNESASSGPIYPTPVIGMVGELPDVARAGRLGFQRAGDAIALVGNFAPSPAASELAKLCGEQLPQELPAIDLDGAVATIVALREAVRQGGLASAHDLAEGGLAVALAECCLAGGLGAQLRVPAEFLDEEGGVAALFGEGPACFLVSGEQAALRRLGERIELTLLGEVGGEDLVIEAQPTALRLSLAELEQAHGALAELFA